MDLYFTGVVVAFLIGMVKLGAALSTRFSIRANNLKKLGLHFRAATGTFEPEGTTPGGWIALAIWLLALAPIGSWISIASAVWTYVSAIRNRKPVPDKVKALHSRVASGELSKDQLVELQEEIQRTLGQPGAALTGQVPFSV